MGNFNRGDRGGRSGGAFERRGYSDRGRRGPVEMHRAVCDNCRKNCEVPFRPTSGKPIFCNDCFRKGENFESKSPDQYKKEFNIINEKLDKILEALGKD